MKITPEQVEAALNARWRVLYPKQDWIPAWIDLDRKAMRAAIKAALEVLES
jgi:hypothetical protein